MVEHNAPPDADAVLRRAIELQHEDAAGAERLSAAELEAVSAEMEIEPRYVRAALAEREERPQPPASEARWWLWGAPRRLAVEERLDRELSRDACEELLEVVRQHAGERGRIRDLLHTDLPSPRLLPSPS